LGRIFATGASLCLNLPVYDTQCGAKLLRAGEGMASLFEKPFGSRWIFDVELLARYMKNKGSGAGLYEHSLASWRDVGESKVRPMDFVRGIGELLRVYRDYALGQPLRPVVLLCTNLFSIYALVGALGTVVHYGLLVAGVELFHAAPRVAAVVGALGGALTNYMMNYHFTFTSARRHSETLPRFGVIAGLSALISWQGARLAEGHGVNYLAAQLVCTLLTLVLGFALNSYWTFASRR
jgi:putative flippase GtrA